VAPPELVEGYKVAADMAERRAGECLMAGDAVEHSAWQKIRTYCLVMAEAKMVDEPSALVNYTPYDESILDRRMLSEIMDDAVEGTTRPWTPLHRLALNAAMRVLSPTERVIAQMHFAAMVRREDISAMLEIAVRTVDKHLENIRKKWDELRSQEEIA
jgi:DNA-binding CsgD family transcriptional regulator